MNEVPPDQGEADEVDDLYRRASAADSSRPSESVRRAVLDHAAQLAAQRSRDAGPVKIDFTRPAANQPWRRPAIFGTLAAAALAGFMIAPQFFSPRVTDTLVSSTTATSQRQSAAAPTAKASADAPDALVAGSQAPANAQANAPANAPPNAPPVPFPAPPLQANDQVAEMKSDKRRDLKAGVPARVAGRVEASPPGTAADSARAETESLANVLVTQAQSAADARSAGAKTEAQRLQSVTSSLGALSGGRAQTAARTAAPLAPQLAPAASAGRAADPAVELRRAAEVGDLPALQALLDTRPAIDARDDTGRTALMLATLHGQSRAAELLLDAGADPNAADLRGTTPLQAAIAANQPAIVTALQRAGAR
jgi:Ankyrin repeats (3 copies)